MNDDTTTKRMDFDTFQMQSEDGQEWEIDFEDGPTRVTSLSWLAYRAMDDDEATVTEL